MLAYKLTIDFVALIVTACLKERTALFCVSSHNTRCTIECLCYQFQYGLLGAMYDEVTGGK